MKIKKFIAGIAACAVAATAMATSVFAADLLTKKGNEGDAAKYAIDFTGIDANKIDKVVANVSVDSEMVNGCIGYNANGDWTAKDQETNGQKSSEWIADGLAGVLGDEPHMEIQFWWVNPFYNEDGTEGDPGTATLTAVTFYDASGNVVKAEGEAPADDDNDDDDNDDDAATTTTTAAGGTTGSADTGVGDIAAVGTVIVAAGVVALVAKKRR